MSCFHVELCKGLVWSNDSTLRRVSTGVISPGRTLGPQMLCVTNSPILLSGIPLTPCLSTIHAPPRLADIFLQLRYASNILKLYVAVFKNPYDINKNYIPYIQMNFAQNPIRLPDIHPVHCWDHLGEQKVLGFL